MKKKNAILIAIVMIILIGLGFYYRFYKTTKPIEVDIFPSNSTSSSSSSLIKTAKKQEVHDFLVKIAKDKYGEIETENTIYLSLKDMQDIYKIDVDKYAGEEYDCSLEHTMLKIVIKNGVKDYQTIINCGNLE